MQVNSKVYQSEQAPLVSVVIPVYNVENYIKQALSSVIKQSYSNIEILLIDDESPDHSISLVRQAFNDTRIRIIQQTNRGLAGARNTGIRYAKGDFVAFLDSDDFWQSNKIEKHMALMLENPNCGVSFCSSLFVDDQSNSLGRFQAPKKKSNYQAKDIFCRNPIGNGSVPVIRKSVLEQISFRCDDKSYCGIPYQQYFDESLRQSEDVDCWTRIAIQTGTEFHYIDQALTNYRLNNEGLSADVDKQFETWSVLLHKLNQYAPTFAKRYGPTAKAFQYRYLARRCVFQGQGRLALRLMKKAFQTKPSALLRESRKTIETAVACICLAVIPEAIQRRIVKALI